jgi:hypothetical protein
VEVVVENQEVVVGVQVDIEILMLQNHLVVVEVAKQV